MMTETENATEIPTETPAEAPPSTETAAEEADDAASEAEAPPAERPLKWYAVHSYSGYEGRVRDALAQRMVQFSLEDSFGEVLIPSETTTETTSSGKTRQRNKVSLPGYLFVQMRMSEEAWHLIKDTPRVIGFIGNQKPREVPTHEIESMRRGIVDGTVKPKPRLSFNVGEEVRVLDGAFANFTGTVDEVNGDKQKLKVIVSIFGRPTSVELDFSTVEKR
jgi:transcription termination/antitermination protein NusG